MATDEGIAPVSSQAAAKRTTIEELQVLVSANHYDILLTDFIGGNGQATSTFSWKLLWKEALYKTKPGVAAYVFVPVKPQLPNQSSVI